MGAADGIRNISGCLSISPRERAAFAAMSRLISCFVTEQILPAFYFALNASETLARGFMLVLSLPDATMDNWIPHTGNIFVIVPLRHEPVLGRDLIADTGRAVDLVDPMDMLPYIYQVENRESEEEWVRKFFVNNTPLKLLCFRMTLSQKFCPLWHATQQM